jgi:hypothetical protein
MKNGGAISNSKLKRLWVRWLRLYEDLYEDPRLRRRLAAPFLSLPPAGHDPASFSILLVGRATRGPWCGTRNPSGTVASRIEATRRFLQMNYSSPFWRFARELSSRIANVRREEPREHWENLVWTNVCKLGEIRDNPSGEVFDRQRDLAVKTLRLETETYRPNLIKFATGDWADAWVAEVVGEPTTSPWREADTLWWLESTTKQPAVLWTKYHPQGTSRRVREAWLRKAKLLATR